MEEYFPTPGCTTCVTNQCIYYFARLDIAETFHKTDNALENLKEWRSIEGHKVFASKIRFQIRLDDFRYCSSIDISIPYTKMINTDPKF